MRQQQATLVVMAAGMGSRFGGLKQLAPMGAQGQALLDYSVYDATRAGFGRVVFIIKKADEKDFREQVGRRVERMTDVSYVFQELNYLPAGYTVPAGREKPWGTGHAILCCRETVKGPFAVINADDFYGAGSYRTLYEAMRGDASRYVMVGFRLKNTLTENGHVARGVCAIDENGMLKRIDERTKIQDCRYQTEDGVWTPLDPNTVVSMNMWGFQPDLFGYLEAAFETFLTTRGADPKAEFFLPFVIDGLVSSGRKQVRVVQSKEKWYGVTYQADAQYVRQALADMTERGTYPPSLL